MKRFCENFKRALKALEQNFEKIWKNFDRTLKEFWKDLERLQLKSWSKLCLSQSITQSVSDSPGLREASASKARAQYV